MAGALTILIMSALLGATSFGIGMLPLFFTFSRTRIAYLSTIGTGLLLGAALGIIIPEGVETLTASNTSDPARKMALSLISGFAFMLVAEQLTSGHAHAYVHKHPYSPLPGSLDARGPVEPNSSAEDFDITLAELEEAEGSESGTDRASRQSVPRRMEGQAVIEKTRAVSTTLGLVIHSLADGLALGASALPGDDGQSNPQLSLIVFLALIVHKAPTALALSMSLMSSLPPAECKKHLAVFSASTPLGALAAFGTFSLLGAGAGGHWPGIALLVSGGTFLYVATVIQPVSHSQTSSPAITEMNGRTRTGLIILGMFIPFFISLISGHEH